MESIAEACTSTGTLLWMPAPSHTVSQLARTSISPAFHARIDHNASVGTPGAEDTRNRTDVGTLCQNALGISALGQGQQGCEREG